MCCLSMLLILPHSAGHEKRLDQNEQRLVALEREIAACRGPSASIGVDEQQLILGLQRIYMALKMEHALSGLSMNISAEIYIEPQLQFREPDKKFSAGMTLFSQIPAGDGPVMLLGDKGIGKSTFVRHECAEWAKGQKGAFGDFDFVFYIDFGAIFTQGRLEFWKGQFNLSIESVLLVYLEAMHNRINCLEELPSAKLLRSLRTNRRCCYLFDGWDHAESYSAPTVAEWLDEMRRGKYQGVDYVLLSSSFFPKDTLSVRAEVTICGFQICDIPKFISAVATSAPHWNLEVKALVRLIRVNEALAEFSNTPLFLLLCCVAFKDLLQRDNLTSFAVADIFNLSLGRLIDGASDREACVQALMKLALKWWNGESLSADVENLHLTGLARTGIICAADWRQQKNARGDVQQQLQWSHNCVAAFYFALRVSELLELDYEEAKRLLMSKFDFFVWRMLFGLTRQKRSTRQLLVKLWIEHHAHLTDRMFEKGLFRLPEFEGIETLLWDHYKSGSASTRRALTQWLILKGDYQQALLVASAPSLIDTLHWTMEMACDAACMAEIYMGLENYGTALKYLLPCWTWWDALPEAQTTGHWRDLAMVALKFARCLRACHQPEAARNFFNISYNVCWKFLHEFDLRDRIMIFEAMEQVTPDVIIGLREVILKLHVLHGEQSHARANHLLRDGYACLGRNELQQARDCFLQAIAIDNETLDVDDVDRASSWNALGCTYVMKLEVSEADKCEARKCFQKAVDIWSASKQCGSRGHARVLANLAAVVEPHHGLELVQEAIQNDPECSDYQVLLQLMRVRCARR